MTPASLQRSFLIRLRDVFLTGVMVLLPLAVIGFMAGAAYQLMLSSVLPITRVLLGPENDYLRPILAILALGGVIFLAGAFAKGPAGRRVTNRLNRWLEQIPVLGTMIGAVRQVADTALNKDDRNLKQTCLVEFPKAGTWCLGLVSAAPRGEIAAMLPAGEDMMAVYVGLPPFTSAFLVFVPRKDVILLKMSADDEVKLLATAGIAYPVSR